MISYELAKQLKDAGFPQISHAFYTVVEGEKPMYGHLTEICTEPFKSVAAPSLEQLIEACGGVFERLSRTDYTKEPKSIEEWEAYSIYIKKDDTSFIGYGKTPEEAVANLWLELHKKE